MKLMQEAKFDEVVTSVFEHLAASFPVVVNLNASVAGFEIVGGQKSVDTGSGMKEIVDIAPSDDEIFFANCVRWLAAEEYLRFGADDHSSFSGVVLTQKALALINVEPKVLKRGIY